MLRLSKRVEYGLIAVRHMASQPLGTVFTAKELAEKLDTPYELLAKVLQKLARGGVVVSQQGINGGYALAHRPEEITISLVIRTIEQERPMIAECYSDGPDSCSLFDNCTIRGPLEKIQRDIDQLFDKMTVLEIV
ncbi:MAG: Rrf2 family transcriptional regulator [Bacteroidota bacterium]